MVPTGEPAFWDIFLFDSVYRDGKIYGRGFENNGQSVILSMFALKSLLDIDLEGMFLGVVYVVNEKTDNEISIQYLLDTWLFSEDDVIMVPDWSFSEKSQVEVVKKYMLWLKVKVKRKMTHGSIFELEINAYRIFMYLLADIMIRLRNSSLERLYVLVFKFYVSPEEVRDCR